MPRSLVARAARLVPLLFAVGCADPPALSVDAALPEESLDLATDAATDLSLAPPRRDDGLTQGTESDRDCGGACPRCANGRACTVHGDCVRGACAGGLCVPAGCADAARNGDESDLD